MRGIALDEGTRVRRVQGVLHRIADHRSRPSCTGLVVAGTATLGIGTSGTCRGMRGPFPSSAQIRSGHTGEALALADVGTNTIESIEGSIKQHSTALEGFLKSTSRLTRSGQALEVELLIRRGGGAGERPNKMQVSDQHQSPETTAKQEDDIASYTDVPGSGQPGLQGSHACLLAVARGDIGA